ncbi:MAG: phospholipid/cholesterol/gamma-HCH transport system substrate-binding protein [Actinomycetota bacterium]|nr:phospholipid/cholesterol/gamma-HCH transport system substrate-binding protein [Actinomycetota bacterium]
MTERNLRRSAIGGLAVTISLMLVAYLIGGAKILQRTYTVTAMFANASDVGTGDPVRVAGIEVGTVTKIQRLPHAVRMELDLHKGTQLSRGTRASIRLRTLLGKKYVQLADPGTGPALAHGAVIPLSRTDPGTDVDEVVTSFDNSLQHLDVQSMNGLLRSFDKVMEGKGQTVNTLLGNLGTLATTMGDRQADLDKLLAASSRLLGAMDDRKAALGSSVDGMSAALTALAARRAELTQLVSGIRDLNTTLTPLLARNEGRLSGVLDDVLVTAKVLDAKRNRIKLALDQLPNAVYALYKVTKQGSWIQVYNVGYPMYPYVADPVDVGDSNGQDPGKQGGLPSIWFRPPAQAPSQNVAGVSVDTGDHHAPPPEGYYGQ